ncbi:MAG: hypothetical protein ABI622_11065 [Chloroflexota bacterium]
MAAFSKYQSFVTELGKGTHKLHSAGDTLKIALTNTAPNAATHTVRADITELATGNGYTQNGAGLDIQNDYTGAAGTGTLTGVDVVITAAGGSVGPFRYVVLFNDTPGAPVDPLVGWWDYGSALTLLDTETFTTDFGASVATIS